MGPVETLPARFGLAFALLVLAACEGPIDTGRGDGSVVPRDGGAGEGGGVDAIAGDAGPPPIECTLPAADYGMARQRLDVPTDSPDRMRFMVPDVPPPDAVRVAMLAFESYDADHPGEEGLIWVNANGPYDVPADATWDLLPGTGEIDVTGATVAGDNLVEIGPGTLVPGTYFEIGNLVIRVIAAVAVCPASSI